MGIKPLDVQVNISQINQVARMQQHEYGHPRDVQLQQGQHLLKQGDAQAHTIQQAHQTDNDESTVKEHKEANQEPGSGGKRRPKHFEDEDEKEKNTEEEIDPEEKANLFEGFS